MNKYQAAADRLAKERREASACRRKRRFESQAEATQMGVDHYWCRYCKGWHRSGSLSRLVAKVRSQGRR